MIGKKAEKDKRNQSVPVKIGENVCLQTYLELTINADPIIHPPIIYKRFPLQR